MSILFGYAVIVCVGTLLGLGLAILSVFRAEGQR